MTKSEVHRLLRNPIYVGAQTAGGWRSFGAGITQTAGAAS
jgi:hypothetical protein